MGYSKYYTLQYCEVSSEFSGVNASMGAGKLGNNGTNFTSKPGQTFLLCSGVYTRQNEEGKRYIKQIPIG
jgi:pyruvate/2-oxoacid:ferredoxin oxidoreductase alpha subunit